MYALSTINRRHLFFRTSNRWYDCRSTLDSPTGKINITSLVLRKMRGKTKNRSNKLHLVFDGQKRREFLTGFHKRKLQRKQKAKERLEKDLKEERKRLKQEAKESYKKLVKSYEPIPEIEKLLSENFEDEDVTVKVLELSTNDIAKSNNWIGVNAPVYEVKHEDEEEEHKIDDIPGMEIRKTTPTTTSIPKPITSKSKKDIKKLLKKQATKKVQQSKVFQTKNRLEMQKQRKKSINEKKLKEKSENKRKKKGRRKK